MRSEQYLQCCNCMPQNRKNVKRKITSIVAFYESKLKEKGKRESGKMKAKKWKWNLSVEQIL